MLLDAIFAMFAIDSSSTFLRFISPVMLIIVIHFKITQLKENYKLSKFSFTS